MSESWVLKRKWWLSCAMAVVVLLRATPAAEACPKCRAGILAQLETGPLYRDLSGHDGATICTITLPIILLTVMAEETDRIVGLEVLPPRATAVWRHATPLSAA